MAKVEDYVNGTIADKVKFGLDLISAEQDAIAGSETGTAMLAEIRPLAPRMMGMTEFEGIVRKARYWAVGHRSCMALAPGSPVTESVFLDELGEALVKAGKARSVTPEDAIATMKQYKSKLIASKVDGQYMEFCRTFAKTCIYWNMEKNGLPCIQR